MTNEEYRRYAGKHMPRSHVGPNCLGAFVAGGVICCIGQGLLHLYGSLGLDEQTAADLRAEVMKDAVDDAFPLSGRNPPARPPSRSWRT